MDLRESDFILGLIWWSWIELHVWVHVIMSQYDIITWTNFSFLQINWFTFLSRYNHWLPSPSVVRVGLSQICTSMPYLNVSQEKSISTVWCCLISEIVCSGLCQGFLPYNWVPFFHIYASYTWPSWMSYGLFSTMTFSLPLYYRGHICRVQNWLF